MFVPILRQDRLSFTMPRYEQAEEEHLLEAAQLLRIMWQEPWSWQPPGWNTGLRNHLKHQVIKFNLPLNLEWVDAAAVATNVWAGKPAKIHGDPTLANLVVGPDGPRWIDPLNRPYIPGDPHVDLGKLYQSCMGYEQVLQGTWPPSINKGLMRCLADTLNLSATLGLVWCKVHFIRLLPYQYDDQRSKMIDLMGSIPETV